MSESPLRALHSTRRGDLPMLREGGACTGAGVHGAGGEAGRDEECAGRRGEAAEHVIALRSAKQRSGITLNKLLFCVSLLGVAALFIFFCVSRNEKSGFNGYTRARIH